MTRPLLLPDTRSRPPRRLRRRRQLLDGGDFVADANKICREGEAKIQEVTREQSEAAGKPQSLEEQRRVVATVLESTAEAYEPYMERLRALEPPSDLEANWTSFLDGVERAFDMIPELADATRAGDQKRLEELSGEFTQIARDTRPFARGQPARRLPARPDGLAEPRVASRPYRRRGRALRQLPHAERLEPSRGRSGVHVGLPRTPAGRASPAACAASGAPCADSPSTTSSPTGAAVRAASSRSRSKPSPARPSPTARPSSTSTSGPRAHPLPLAARLHGLPLRRLAAADLGRPGR